MHLICISTTFGSSLPQVNHELRRKGLYMLWQEQITKVIPGGDIESFE